MDILTHALSALWKVAAVALVLGAGLPAVFALGLRSLSAGHLDSPDGAPAGGTSRSRLAGRIGAAVCFGVVVAVAAFGLVVIVFGKQLFG